MNIQWYPGHMTKTRRQIEADLKHIGHRGDHRRPDPGVQPEPGHRRHHGRQAPAGGAQPGRPGRSGREPGLGAWFRKKGLVGAGDRRENRRRGESVLPCGAGGAEGPDRPLAGEGSGRPSGAGHGGWSAQCGQVHLYQQGRPEEVGQGQRPPRRHLGKQWVTVDRGWSCWTRPGSCGPSLRTWETGMRLAFTGAVKDEIMDGWRPWGAT